MEQLLLNRANEERKHTPPFHMHGFGRVSRMGETVDATVKHAVDVAHEAIESESGLSEQDYDSEVKSAKLNPLLMLSHGGYGGAGHQRVNPQAYHLLNPAAKTIQAGIHGAEHFAVRKAHEFANELGDSHSAAESALIVAEWAGDTAMNLWPGSMSLGRLIGTQAVYTAWNTGMDRAINYLHNHSAAAKGTSMMHNAQRRTGYRI